MNPIVSLGARLATYAMLLAAGTYGLFRLASALPPLDSGLTVNLQVSLLRDIKELAGTLQVYSDHHFAHVFTLFTAFYLYKQAFSIPGALALNLIAGSLYGIWGTVMAVTYTACGASLCYIIGHVLLAPLMRRYMATRPQSAPARLRAHVARERRRGTIFYYLVFLRLFPFTPNWALNLASPVIEVPLPMFAASVLLGLAPYNVVTTQAGALLSSLEDLSDIVRPSFLLKLAAVALVALLPVAVKRRAAAAGYVPEEADELDDAAAAGSGGSILPTTPKKQA